MCGILFTSDRSIEKESFIEALSLIQHRGPDKPLCYHRHNQYQLGHNRLSIMDTNDRSNQPFFSEDGRYCIIFNGEIYNFRELAKQYNVQPRTTSDTEVLLLLFIQYGPEMLNWLNGMFSFIILDTERNTFFVARDRLGVKPLFYYRDADTYIFASEIAPIVALIGKVSIDEIALRQFRKLRTLFNERTIYSQIQTFPAGHYMSEGKLHRYWELQMSEQEPPTDEELRSLIESAVKLRKISDVSVGSYLSGGLDSTIIAGLSEVEHTWTVGFSELNEFPWSSIAAAKMNSHHHEILIDKDEFLALTSEIVRKSKELVSVPNEVLIYKMTKQVKRHNTVILSGEGADELFYGYDRIFRWAHSSSSWDTNEFSKLYSYGSIQDIEIVEDAVQPFMKYGSTLHIVSAFFQIAHLHGLLRRLDRATMLCGVEARGPFLDYRLVERLAGVPFEYKMSQGIVKAPLKRIFADIVPGAIIDREKMGFPVPVENIMPESIPGNSYMDKWFEYNYRTLMEDL